MSIEKKADKASDKTGDKTSDKFADQAPANGAKPGVDPERARAAERAKALEAALGQIDKQFGAGSVMRMGEKEAMAIETISTGALPLDIALGVDRKSVV